MRSQGRGEIRLKPRLAVLEVPIDRPLQPVLPLHLCRPPQLSQLGCLQKVPLIVKLAILHIVEGLARVQAKVFADILGHTSHITFGRRANVVNFAHDSLVQDGVKGGSHVVHIPGMDSGAGGMDSGAGGVD